MAGFRDLGPRAFELAAILIAGLAALLVAGGGRR